MAKKSNKPERITLLSSEERERYESLKETFRRETQAGVTAFAKAADALLTIRNERLYREQYTTWQDFCREEFAFSKTYANNLINAMEVVRGLMAQGEVVLPNSEYVARQLSKYPKDMRVLIWRKAKKIAEGRNPDYISVRDAALQIMPGHRAKKLWKEEVLRKLRIARRNLRFDLDFTLLDKKAVKEVGKVIYEIQLLTVKHLGAVVDRLAEFEAEEQRQRTEQANRPRLTTYESERERTNSTQTNSNENGEQS